MIYEADLRADSPNVTRTGVRATPESRFLRDTTPDSDRQGRSKVQLAGNAGPDYPRSAREAGWEGTVMLRVEVLPNGSAGQVNLRKSSGYSVLDEAALSAVQQWRFVPALDGHFPVRSLVDLPIRFDLMDSLP
jgi:TonB family protein